MLAYVKISVTLKTLRPVFVNIATKESEYEHQSAEQYHELVYIQTDKRYQNSRAGSPWQRGRLP